MTDATPPPGAPSGSGAAPEPGRTAPVSEGPVFEEPAAGGPVPDAPPRRGRRGGSRWRAAFFGLAGIAIVAAVAWALLGNRVFVVRSVSVTGTHLLTQEQVTAAAGIPLGTPLLRADTGAATRRVEAIKQVASATVTVNWPDHVTIAVTERVPVMAVRMAGGGYDLVDPAGVIVRWAKKKPGSLPLLVTSLSGAGLRGAPPVVTAADVLGELQPWLARQVAQVRTVQLPAGPQEVTLDLRDGKSVQWGSPGNAGQKNRELSALLSGGAHDIDVSAPGTVVTK